MTVLTLLPAVDIAGGSAEQVGAAGDGDPAAVTRGLVRDGASWLHLVDLDRARGRGDNLELLTALVADLPVPVQLSGGITDERSLQGALATGAARVNLGSAALRDPGWLRDVLQRHGDQVTVGVDVRGAEVVARGSDTRIGSLAQVLGLLAELPTRMYVVADAHRDGRMRGVDLDLFRAMTHRLGAPVIASGGVSTLADLRGLRELTASGLCGVVLGAALHRGAFTLRQALAVVQDDPSRAG